MLREKWGKVLIIGLVLAAANAAYGGAFRPVVAEGVSFGFLIIMVGSARRLRGPIRLPWLLFVASAAFFILAGAVRFVHGSLVGVVAPFPSSADPFFYLGYIAIFAGEIVLVRRRTTEPAWDHLIDALIVAAGLGVLIWAGLLGTYVRDGSISSLERSMTVAYSMLDLLLIAATARLAVGPGARSTAWYLMASAALVIFASDLLATFQTIGSYKGDGVAMISCLPYVFFATAALHPSLRKLPQPTPNSPRRLTKRRQVILGCALLMSPAVVIYQLRQGNPVDLPVVMVGWVVLALLVLQRLALLIKAKERLAAQEQILREGSASLATSTGRHMMNRNTLQAVSRLAEGAEDLRVSMALVADRDLEIADAVGHLAEQAVATTTPVDSLPNDMASVLRHRTAVSLTNTSPIDLGSSINLRTRSIFVAPLVSQNDLSGAIIVTTARPIPREAQRGIELLASTASLALESAILTEDLLRRKSERRFRALVENSSDIVLVISTEQRISFVSSAAHHLLGYSDETILGTDPAPWIHPADREMAASLLMSDTHEHLDHIPVELRLRHADGTFRWFEVRTRDMRHDAEILGLVVNAREITDRKATEQLLATSEARFRALVQNSSDVVAVVDLNGLFSYVSPAITSMLGHSPDQLVGSRVVDLFSHDELTRLRQTHAMFLDENLPAHPVSSPNVEIRLRGREGEWHTVDITTTDLRHEPAIGGIVLNARDITVRKALEHDLRHQALHDGLTGLANRTMFTERLTETLRVADDRHLIGALFIDIDDFKSVNDSLGHTMGDELLIDVAERLLTCVHPADVVARLGGDEFAILVVAPWGVSEIVKIAERVLLTLQAPFTLHQQELHISASVGIAVDSDRASDAGALLRNAAMAMYLAKERGKARFEMFEERMQASVFERLELKTDLAVGIEEGQLRLLYQPIVSLETGRITGVEALVRWEHPTKGMLPPDAFIPLAEETGLIIPLGQWVMEEACQQLQGLQLGLPTNASLTMSVNFSAHQLQVAGLVETVAGTISRFGLDPSTITLEITETVLMQDTELSQVRLAELRDIGVSLAVDDFGTGYSSLQYVQRFPIDIIKIDRSFVSGLGEHAGDVVVVQSMIELAQRLGVRVVAEGIERAEQVSVLQSLGADSGQGYYFSRPVTAAAIGDLLVRSLAEGPRFLYQP